MSSKKGTHGKQFYADIEKLKANADKIKDYRAQGMALREMLAQLEISQNNYYRIVREYPELGRPIREGQHKLVLKLTNELLKLCEKHTLITTKTYTKKDPKTGDEIITEETTKKEVDADIAAIQILLKNNAEGWSDNPAEFALKLREFEWKQKVEAEEKGISIPQNQEEDETDDEDEDEDDNETNTEK